MLSFERSSSATFLVLLAAAAWARSVSPHGPRRIFLSSQLLAPEGVYLRADTCHFLKPSREFTQIVSRFKGTPKSEHRVEMAWPVAEPRYVTAGCLHENLAQHLVVQSIF